MIRIKVEIVSAITGKTTELGAGTICNVGGTKQVGDYRCELRDKGGRAWKTTRVQDFPRQKLLAWDLLFRCLKEAVGDRNGEPTTPDDWKQLALEYKERLSELRRLMRLAMAAGPSGEVQQRALARALEGVMKGE